MTEVIKVPKSEYWEKPKHEYSELVRHITHPTIVKSVISVKTKTGEVFSIGDEVEYYGYDGKPTRELWEIESFGISYTEPHLLEAWGKYNNSGVAHPRCFVDNLIKWKS